MNNRHKRFKLERKVIIEKFSSKYYILNANDYLWRLGIAIYMESTSGTEPLYGSSRYSRNYLNPKNLENLNELIGIYGIAYIYELFKTFSTNKKLRKLRHNPILLNHDNPQLEGVIKESDGHHFNYRHGLLDKDGAHKYLLLRFNTLRALNQAGFLLKDPDFHSPLYKIK